MFAEKVCVALALIVCVAEAAVYSQPAIIHTG